MEGKNKQSKESSGTGYYFLQSLLVSSFQGDQKNWGASSVDTVVRESLSRKKSEARGPKVGACWHVCGTARRPVQLSREGWGDWQEMRPKKVWGPLGRWNDLWVSPWVRMEPLEGFGQRSDMMWPGMLKIPFGIHMSHSLKNGKDGQGEQRLQWSRQEMSDCSGRVLTGRWWCGAILDLFLRTR